MSLLVHLYMEMGGLLGQFPPMSLKGSHIYKKLIFK